MLAIVAAYTPDPKTAIFNAIVQFILIGILTAALHAYLRPRCGDKATRRVLLFAQLIALIPLGLDVINGYGEVGGVRGDLAAKYPNWLLVLTAYFELFRFLLWSFLCLVTAGLVLFLVSFAKVRVLGAPKSPGGAGG